MSFHRDFQDVYDFQTWSIFYYFFEYYQLSKQNENKVDFDDLLILTEELFSKFPEILKK
jgi:superfamily I DNA/RNA helicase